MCKNITLENSDMSDIRGRVSFIDLFVTTSIVVCQYNDLWCCMLHNSTVHKGIFFVVVVFYYLFIWKKIQLFIIIIHVIQICIEKSIAVLRSPASWKGFFVTNTAAVYNNQPFHGDVLMLRSRKMTQRIWIAFVTILAIPGLVYIE